MGFFCDKFIVSPYLEERVDVDESANKYISYSTGASGEKEDSWNGTPIKCVRRGKNASLVKSALLTLRIVPSIVLFGQRPVCYTSAFLSFAASTKGEMWIPKLQNELGF